MVCNEMVHAHGVEVDFDDIILVADDYAVLMY